AYWALFCGLYSLVLYGMARTGRLKGILQYIIYLPFVSLPGIVLLLSHLYLPAGSATYLNGPPIYLYFFVIFMSGFFFSRLLSILAGLLAGAQYFVFYILASDHIATITAADELVQQDLTSPEIYFFRALMIVAAGPITAVLSENSKKLMLKMLNEQEEKSAIDRLFGQFVSNEVKNKIISEKRDLIGNRKQVVVLFSDIRSFSTFSEGKDPEAIVGQLNEYFDRMVECVVNEGGTVDKFIGDAIMVVFGGLLELERPCDNALRAALNMRAQLNQLNAEWRTRGLPVFEAGIGLHFGEVLEGTIGSKDRKEFTVIGDTVNTAARLEGVTKEYQRSIVLSDSVYAGLSSDLQARCESLGETRVKGKQTAVRIYGAAA
ncbi:MAG: adenylate/guanylate cyclase domain-containing protein, partial [Leptospiraceae bacterium]|nr:adenylate/guanylate cyclase domain-containing protein [Leptospiraceae bacterium]